MAKDKTDNRKATVIEVPQVIGVLDTHEDLQKAFYDPRLVGLDHSNISLLADEKSWRKSWATRTGAQQRLKMIQRHRARISSPKKPLVNLKEPLPAGSSLLAHC